MAADKPNCFFDITLHKMICSKGDFSSLFEISHVNGQILATFKYVKHHRRGTEIFIKHLPPDILLQEILEFVFSLGQVYQIRILLEFSGFCRGYCYVNFFEIESARKAIIVLCGKKIRDTSLVVKMSFDNNKLEIPNIPKGPTPDEVFAEVSKVIGNGLQEIYFVSPKDLNKDSLSCILTYNTHKNALEARKKVFDGFELFGRQMIVDWAVPEEKIKSKRLYFEIPLPKLTKPEFYEEITKIIKPRHILNIFLQNGIGYLTLENESVAYESFKSLKLAKLFGFHLKLSFRKFYTRLPNAEKNYCLSETSDSSDNQVFEEATFDGSNYLQHDRSGASDNSRYSSFSSNENISPTVLTYPVQPPIMMQTVPNVPTFPLHQETLQQLQNSQLTNYRMSINAPEQYQICGMPYPSRCDYWVSQYRQNQFVDEPFRIVQLNSNVNNTPVHFFQMTQDFYRHIHRY